MKLKASILVLILLIPQLIFANAGTALMWVPIFQLMWGNLVIGLVEGVIVYLVFRVKPARAILIMILANYATWIAGNFLINLLQNGPIDKLFDLRFVFEAWCISLVILYFLTVFLEALFVFWILKKQITYWKSSFISALFNIVTYSIMIFIYLQLSSFSFFTETQIDQSITRETELVNYEIYFVDSDNKSVKEYAPETNTTRVITEFDKDLYYPYLKLEKGTESVKLYLSSGSENIELIDSSFCELEDSVYYDNLKSEFYFSRGNDFRLNKNRNWEAYTGDWAIEGLTIKHDTSNVERFAFEVPWMFWDMRDLNIISDSELLVNINGRVILMNVKTKTVAFLFRASDYKIKK